MERERPVTRTLRTSAFLAATEHWPSERLFTQWLSAPEAKDQSDWSNAANYDSARGTVHKLGFRPRATDFHASKVRYDRTVHQLMGQQ